MSEEKMRPEMSLGKTVTYENQYNPKLLFAIPRQIKRQEIGVPEALPFYGADYWNAYEFSCLNEKGKPIVALINFVFPCQSPNIIESKSFKLYLNTFNNSRFESLAAVKTVLQKDVSSAAGAAVEVKIFLPKQIENESIKGFKGVCLDDLDIDCDQYQVFPDFLGCESDLLVKETVYSDLLKSNCLVTGQPDWASIQIHYHGKKMNHQGLLKYLISFRDHHEFHEQCVERVFMDISKHCQPKHLSVYARYTRRGGLDINPFRSSDQKTLPANIRLARQ